MTLYFYLLTPEPDKQVLKCIPVPPCLSYSSSFHSACRCILHFTDPAEELVVELSGPYAFAVNALLSLKLGRRSTITPQDTRS
jgi:hypothetical protein